MTRINAYRADPEGYKRLLAWNTHLVDGPLSPSLRALVELRVSQINGCAFCVVMHCDEARAAGVDQAKLDAIAAWRDAEAYSDAERAALALAESMTRLADSSGVPEYVWAAAAAQFDEASLASLVEVISLINAFNRINVATGRTAGDYARFRTASAER